MMKGSDNRNEKLAEVLLRMALELSTDELLAHFRAAMSAFGAHHYAVYAVDGSIAHLRSSCGVARTVSTLNEARIVVAQYPELLELLAGGQAFVVASTPLDDAFLNGRPRLDPAKMTAVFNMRNDGRTGGFVMLFGSLPQAIAAEPEVSELVRLVDTFSAAYFNAQAYETAERGYRKALAHIKQLHDNRDILLLGDLESILISVANRATEVLECSGVGIWLKDAERWSLVKATGNLDQASGDHEQEALLEQALEERKTVAVTALAGEVTSELNADDLVLAAQLLFPLTTSQGQMGCLVAFDATASGDQIDAARGVASMAATAIEAWRASEERAGKRRMEEQLALAANIQAQLRPAEPTSSSFLDVAYMSRYCDETGGDYIDFLGGDAEGWHLVVGDVSGHGLGAAMLMVDTRARLRTLAALGSVTRPDTILNKISETLAPSLDEFFITMALVLLQPVYGRILYAGAGHEPPLLLRARERRWESLENTGLAVGMDVEERYELASYAVRRGDTLVVLTDGVTEAEDPAGSPFGIERVCRIIEDAGDVSAQDVVAAVVTAVENHRGGERLVDDLTLLVAKVQRAVLRIEEEAPQPPGVRISAQSIAGSLTAKDEALERALSLLSGHFPGQEMTGVQIAIEEALSNAVRHGCGGDATKQVQFELWADGQASLSVVVHDSGNGFNPLAVLPDVDDEDTLHRSSGRGLVMMVSEMDDVAYWDTGRGVTLVKFLNQSPVTVRMDRGGQ